MGLPDGQEANSREVFIPSCMSESSEDSMLLSCGSSPGKSLELESVATGSCNSNGSSSRSSQLVDTTPSRNSNIRSAGQSQCNLCAMCPRQRELDIHDLRNSAVRNPDDIRWIAEAKKVTITRTAGKVGFKYRAVAGDDLHVSWWPWWLATVKGPSRRQGLLTAASHHQACHSINSGQPPTLSLPHSEDQGKETPDTWYTMVIKVFANGPSAGRINIGDWILSVNGQPLQVSKGINLKSVIGASKSETVTLMIQSPERKLYHKKCHKPSCADRTPQSTGQARDGLNSNTLMPRLPQVRVLISGSEAEPLATSILQGATQLRLSATEVGVSYQAFVSKKNFLYTKNVKQKELVGNLDQFESSKSVDEVKLEVIALKNTPFSTYCHHVLATAHSIFIVQFSSRAFINNRQSVLMSIQQRLNKIRTYASDRVPIYLVMTSEDVALPAGQLAMISESLNCQFYDGFKNQLQYNAATDYPLFTAVAHHPGGGGDARNLPSPFGNLGRQISREDNSDTGQSHVLYSRDNNSLDVCYYAKSTELCNSQGDRYDVRELREHLSKSAFQQDFISRRYPYSFMLHRKRLKQQEVNNLHYLPKAWIMTVCGGIQSNFDHLLRFLHDNGDIVCSDYLEYSSSNSDMILLDREYLITMTKRLTTIPSRSQQQDPRLNDSIRHWDDLQEKSTASSMFLKYLFHNNLESLNILATLGQMNLIHCLELSSPNSQSVTSHIVPFFLPDKKTPSTRAYNHDPKLYNLCVDFHGSIPDGFFWTGLVELIKEAEKSNGTWSVESATSAHLSLGIDCEFDVECDEVQSVINISARCSVAYQHRDLLYLLNRIFKPLAAIQSHLRITIGPPCPLYQEQCRTRMQVPSRAHVMDVEGGRAVIPLWCGNLRVDEYPTVNRWLCKTAEKPPMTRWNADKVPVSRKTHISNLPPAMVHFICNQLMVSPTGKDWQGLAGVLGYTHSEVTAINNRSQNGYEACNSFLQEWAVFANSTLDSLMKHLACQHMGRMDILTRLSEDWFLFD